jgi:hypothetical protein
MQSIRLVSCEHELVGFLPRLPQGLCKIGQEFRHGRLGFKFFALVKFESVCLPMRCGLV